MSRESSRLSAEQTQKIFGLTKEQQIDELRMRARQALDVREEALYHREIARLSGSRYLPPDPEGRTEEELGMDDLNEVGMYKPLGYLGVDADNPETLLGYSVSELRQFYHLKGLRTLYISSEEGSERYETGALVVYDPIYLQLLLDDHRELLEKEEWPTTAAEFARMVMFKSGGRRGSPLHKLISTAFCDWGNM